MSGIKQADSVSMSYQVNVGGKRPPEVKHCPEKPGQLFFKRGKLSSNHNYPVILRILGFFSSSFSRKIHHPWLQIAPQYHRVDHFSRGMLNFRGCMSCCYWILILSTPHPCIGGSGNPPFLRHEKKTPEM